jgi:hypothetical protein
MTNALLVALAAVAVAYALTHPSTRAVLSWLRGRRDGDVFVGRVQRTSVIGWALERVKRTLALAAVLVPVGIAIFAVASQFKT